MSSNEQLNELLQNITSAAAAGRRSRMGERTELYCARVDVHTEGMDDKAKLAFLRAELEKWIARFEAFQVAVARDEPFNGTAWDYHETMAALNVRIAQLQNKVAA